MTIFRSEETLVALFAIALIPWIGWTLRRALRDGMLPIGRTHVRRDERRAAFILLFGLYCAAAMFAGIVSTDLLIGL